MERAPWVPIKLQTGLKKGWVCLFSSGLPSYMHFNPVACVQFLKGSFAEHLLRARHALAWWLLPQRKASPSFINCSQWGHSGFHPSWKCAGTKKGQAYSPIGVWHDPIFHYLCNKSHFSDFHFNTSVLDNNRVFSGIKFYLISYNQCYQLNVCSLPLSCFLPVCACGWGIKGKGRDPLSVPNTWCAGSRCALNK